MKLHYAFKFLVSKGESKVSEACACVYIGVCVGWWGVVCVVCGVVCVRVDRKENFQCSASSYCSVSKKKSPLLFQVDAVYCLTVTIDTYT